ncbi:hypothetical protein VKT23_010024 [Stygiomarasmius scandens]|uniref:Protein-S-isoprenylcysteine O-methyltransferase n=1 Tax=Marasmiellus scandens TaxID=2682957 RepID=A0ABR1JFG4_9AGAR
MDRAECTAKSQNTPSLWRLPFTFATIWGIHISMTPPNKRPPDHELELNNIQNEANSNKDASSLSVKKRRNTAENDTHEDKSSQLTALERRRESVLTTYIPAGGKALFHIFVALEIIISIAIFSANSNPLKRRVIDYALPFIKPLPKPNVFYPQSVWHLKLIFITDALRPSPQLMLGAIMTLIGGFLRSKCYKAMKELFTFELSVRKGHRLVTWGPYTYVRHPSYTGALLAGSGTILSLVVGRGSWARECLWPFLYYRVLIPLFPFLRGSDETDLRAHGRAPGNSTDPSFSLDLQSFDVGPTLVVFALTLFLAWAIFVPRMKREDAMMEREFGDEWRNWRNKVRCKLIPGIY